jgi:hypothetical protein
MPSTVTTHDTNDQKTSSVHAHSSLHHGRPAFDPALRADRTLSTFWARRLARRTPLALDASRPFAVKRCVHELMVDVSASAFAHSMAEAVADPGAVFGVIRLRRLAERVGRPFEEGERFHGALSLARLTDAAISGTPLRFARGALARLLGSRLATPMVRLLEAVLLSDYALVEELSLEGAGAPAARERRDGSPAAPGARLRYRYLSGTPIAGSSTIEVAPIGPSSARVTVVFEFQELEALALGVLHGFALPRHDQAVHAIVAAAAARAGGCVTESTIPAAYLAR